ncbi:TetR/AcrR family transcriptional regulator [Vibrio neonatus]|uniref:TetR/AcrR family transcriptional regulator n=1 Tax=Vibrio neonatus TaxID=278860 RepID=UPI0021C45D75|nr:TetR/AcrR family transcriptional regulator [Vibrio neonatus]
MAKLAEIKQENIICAAIEIFSEKGLDQASMEAIAKKAAVSKRTLYKYYPTKESLFSVIIERLLSSITVLSDIAFEQTQSLTEQLTDIAEKEVKLLCSAPFIAVTRMVMRECMGSKALANVLMEKLESLESANGMTQWIEQGINAKQLKVEHPAIASEQFIASLKSIIFWPQLMAHTPPPDVTTQRIVINCAVQQFVAAYQIK